MFTVKNFSREELSKEFEKLCADWVNSSEYNSKIYDEFTQKSLQTKELYNHIKIVEELKSGYGERAFRYLWVHIVNQMSSGFNFLEIGVYKGSVLSLVEIISQCFDIDKKIYGLSPMNSSGDKYSSYEEEDYFKAIEKLYFNLGVEIKDTNIIKGYSTDPDIKNQIKNLNKFDIIYIDGSHNYEDVVSDIELAKTCLATNGLLVLDDASSNINLGPSPQFNGHQDVADAIKDYLENDGNYTHLLALGHNRIFKKTNA